MAVVGWVIAIAEIFVVVSQTRIHAVVHESLLFLRSLEGVRTGAFSSVEPALCLEYFPSFASQTRCQDRLQGHGSSNQGWARGPQACSVQCGGF